MKVDADQNVSAASWLGTLVEPESEAEAPAADEPDADGSPKTPSEPTAEAPQENLLRTELDRQRRGAELCAEKLKEAQRELTELRAQVAELETLRERVKQADESEQRRQKVVTQLVDENVALKMEIEELKEQLESQTREAMQQQQQQTWEPTEHQTEPEEEYGPGYVDATTSAAVEAMLAPEPPPLTGPQMDPGAAYFAGVPPPTLPGPPGEVPMTTVPPPTRTAVSSQAAAFFAEACPGGNAMTTVTVSCIPAHSTQDDFIAMLDTWGLAGTYDFLHIAWDSHSAYAIINFIDPAFMLLFCWSCQEWHFTGIVMTADTQGYEANVARWANPDVNEVEDADEQPFTQENPEPSRWSVEKINKMLNPEVCTRHRKTRMCVFYAQKRCDMSTNCRFAHSQAELQPIPDLAKTKLCFNHFRGRCAIEDCKFAHGSKELQHAEGEELQDWAPAQYMRSAAWKNGRRGNEKS
eukprot:TRINITY_DN9769_c0_g3_i1.p1 TRINITY_DN9769_c0_g3~~TRINITY_DN9769_c0_g3_i1.p1  ORF type:complete len:467 (-),score=91.80 TRINITY_DN9769_c0_g3_i1:44-1444(-)